MIEGLLNQVDQNVDKETVLDNFKLGELPVLSVKFIELLELLVGFLNFFRDSLPRFKK